MLTLLIRLKRRVEKFSHNQYAMYNFRAQLQVTEVEVVVSFRTKNLSNELYLDLVVSSSIPGRHGLDEAGIEACARKFSLLLLLPPFTAIIQDTLR